MYLLASLSVCDGWDRSNFGDFISGKTMQKHSIILCLMHSLYHNISYTVCLFSLLCVTIPPLQLSTHRAQEKINSDGYLTQLPPTQKAMILTVYSQSGGEESNEFICINLVSNIQFYFIPHVLF